MTDGALVVWAATAYAGAMAKVVVTVSGPDRPGLVSELAEAVAEAGGNWLTSQMARLAGTFAGVVLVNVPQEAGERLRAAVEGLDEALHVRVDPAADDASVPGDPAWTAAGTCFEIHLLGQDRPGIVREVTGALAAHGVTIDELSSWTAEAPMAGGILFEADLVVRIPQGGDSAAVRDALEALAAELMVDLEMAASGLPDATAD